MKKHIERGETIEDVKKIGEPCRPPIRVIIKLSFLPFVQFRVLDVSASATHFVSPGAVVIMSKAGMLEKLNKLSEAYTFDEKNPPKSLELSNLAVISARQRSPVQRVPGAGQRRKKAATGTTEELEPEAPEAHEAEAVEEAKGALGDVSLEAPVEEAEEAPEEEPQEGDVVVELQDPKDADW